MVVPIVNHVNCPLYVLRSKALKRHQVSKALDIYSVHLYNSLYVVKGQTINTGISDKIANPKEDSRTKNKAQDTETSSDARSPSVVRYNHPANERREHSS